MIDFPKSADSADRGIDPGARQIAGIYAKALLGAAESAGLAETTVDELESIKRDVLDRFPKLRDVLASGFIAVEDKIKLLDRAFGQRVSAVLLNFLKVMARHDRLTYLGDVAVVARQQLEHLRGLVRVEVITAAPLPAAQSAAILQQLRGMLGGQPVLAPRVNPDIIGGIVLRVGDTVYDGSIATRLADIRGRMINRSVHEIQSRRDRFRHSAGN